MLHQLFNIDRHQKFVLACSGGVDSMAIADFYRRGNKSFTIAYFNHSTAQSMHMQEHVQSWANQNKLNCDIGHLTNSKPKDLSWEEFWRNERYEWLKSFNLPIVTCHHLNDAVETWVFSSLHGNPKIISHRNNNIWRPFLTNEKEELKQWCIEHDVSWVEDESNNCVDFPRNRIRHVLMPEIERINPGIKKTIRKKILAARNSETAK